MPSMADSRYLKLVETRAQLEGELVTTNSSFNALDGLHANSTLAEAATRIEHAVSCVQRRYANPALHEDVNRALARR